MLDQTMLALARGGSHLQAIAVKVFSDQESRQNAGPKQHRQKPLEYFVSGQDIRHLCLLRTCLLVARVLPH